jgi:hypothetical protein
MPLALNDSELQIVLTAVKPIHPRNRDQFLRDCAVERAKYEVLGSGIIGRVVAKIQRQHLAPRTSHNVGSKYGH